MIITHNLQAMNINHIVNANITAHAKSTSKISSGYKINRAADNPAGLAMSEAMRKQIRGLMQGINNTRDGVAFVQIADGAMDEIHTMLQRMNELSLKASNGLCSQEDRNALNAEFDQLRTEIDRINNTTTFNTMPVFDEHEASYYQICGNRQWKDNQLHTITSSENTLSIHLPDSYDPKDYTLTVPAGTYTTQELIDEIDDALMKMQPPNPGFVFEYTSDGYCNLNFESAEGKPTNIKMIDGPLAYLIYDFQPGGSPASLLGTSPFELDEFGNPRQLRIVEGQNDELIFYAESAEGTKRIGPIVIPPGEYTRDRMIDEINRQLGGIADAKGITAKPYGDSYIQITGGEGVNITGLKGNMFKFETKPPIYTSVFYDNVIYGTSVKDSAQITGYDHSASNIKIYEDTARQNNILCFQVNSDDVRTIQIPKGEYTVADLTDKINELLKNQGLDKEVRATLYGSSIRLSSLISGTKSTLKFDTSNPVYANTYETLFLKASGPTITQDGRVAFVEGSAHLDGEIDLKPDVPLIFFVGNDRYTIDTIGGKHPDLNSLLDKLNAYVDKTPSLNGKIKFYASGNQLLIQALTTGVDRIHFGDHNEGMNKTYYDLFTRKDQVPSGNIISDTSTVEENQGKPGSYTPNPSLISTSAGPCKLPVTIDESNNQIKLRLSQYSQWAPDITLTLSPGTYNTMEQLTREINKQLSAAGDVYKKYLKADYVGNTLKFDLTMPTNGELGLTSGTWNFSLRKEPNSVLSALLGTTESTIPPDSRPGSPAKVTTRYPLIDHVELSSQYGNNTFDIIVDGTPHTLTINGTFNNRTDLLNAIKTAINNSPLKGTVSANLDYSNRLVFTSTDPTVQSLDARGAIIFEGLYSVPDSYKNNGSCTFDPPCVIGRRDLTRDPIEITAGMNDTITFDFTYPKDGKMITTPISVTIPEKTYQNGYELVDVLNAAIKEELAQDELFGVDGDFDLSFSIGGKTDVDDDISKRALQISVKNKTDQEPENGQYIVDGVRGNAACYVFYKTASMPSVTYIVGTKDIREGITFEPGKNVLNLSVNSVPYQYTFEENKYYTADEFIDELNRRFNEGDDNGNPASLRATLENGAVKIWHKTVGENTITDISGSARSTIFFEEEGRDYRNPLILQVGAEQRSTIELPRIRVNSASLGINSITISQAKYADKAIKRIKSAINLLSGRRSTYGAMQNRLEHTVNNNENVTEQIQASDTRIRDTDMSSELIRYSNLNLLLQAGHKMITHSNNNIKKLLTILE